MTVVAHVGRYDPASTSGVDRIVAGLVDYLPLVGVECEVWHFTDCVTQPRRREVGGVSVVDLPVRRLSGLAGVTRLPWRLPDSTLSWLATRASEVDLVHLHSVYRPENIWASRLGVPYVVTPHGGYNAAIFAGRHRIGKLAWFRLLDRRVLAQAAVVHVVSASEREQVEMLGAARQIVEIPNSVRPADLAATVSAPGVDPTWLFVGRLDTRVKGLDLLLRGYAAASAEVELPRLVIAGPDVRGELPALTRLAGDLGIDDRVTWHGQVDDRQRAELLAAACLVLYLSRSEGFPLGVLEALAAGRPCLVTPVADPDGCLSGPGAVIRTEPTVSGAAEGMRRAARLSPAELATMGRAGRRLVEDEYLLPVVVGRIATLYDKVLAGVAR